MLYSMCSRLYSAFYYSIFGFYTSVVVVVIILIIRSDFHIAFLFPSLHVRSVTMPTYSPLKTSPITITSSFSPKGHRDRLYMYAFSLSAIFFWYFFYLFISMLAMKKRPLQAKRHRMMSAQLPIRMMAESHVAFYA